MVPALQPSSIISLRCLGAKQMNPAACVTPTALGTVSFHCDHLLESKSVGAPKQGPQAGLLSFTAASPVML